MPVSAATPKATQPIKTRKPLKPPRRLRAIKAHNKKGRGAEGEDVRVGLCMSGHGLMRMLITACVDMA